MTVSEILGCASATNKRIKHDFYETPAWCIHALARVEQPYWRGLDFWEPCDGAGSISRVLRSYGRKVVTGDLTRNRNFLKTETRRAKAIVTNPPYKHATEFILHAHRLGVAYHAWLLKGDFLNAQRAISLIDEVGYPERVWALTKRPDFRNQDAPPMNCSWYIFTWRRRTSAALRLLAPDDD